ncbi:ATP-binding cassette domain-containing protein [Streptomyces sp. AD2-2]|nr:ATP-binding cassette domain-containing protein [Streptomyces sp. AD2-2]
MLTVTGLRKRWGPVQALDGFDLRIEPGEICGLIGHNGAGKTTFARIVAGLERPDAGTVVAAGANLTTAPRSARRLIGLAPRNWPSTRPPPSARTCASTAASPACAAPDSAPNSPPWPRRWP